MRAAFIHSVYRLKQTQRNIPLYCRFPRLLVLEGLYVLEEALAFFCRPLRAFFANSQASSSLYGTMTFNGLATIAGYIDDHRAHHVVDIGAGKGKVLLYFSLVHRWRCTGIEPYTPFFVMYALLCRLFFQTALHQCIHATVEHADVPRASVYFISGLDFSPATLQGIQRLLRRQTHQYTVVSVGVAFALPHCTQHSLTVPTSWGECCVYIYTHYPVDMAYNATV